MEIKATPSYLFCATDGFCLSQRHLALSWIFVNAEAHSRIGEVWRGDGEDVKKHTYARDMVFLVLSVDCPRREDLGRGSY